jgi:hypothetical protein
MSLRSESSQVISLSFHRVYDIYVNRSVEERIEGEVSIGCHKSCKRKEKYP